MGILAMGMLLDHQAWCSGVVLSTCTGVPTRGRHTVMLASACVAGGIAPGDRQRLHACSHRLSKARRKQSLRQAENRRRSQWLIIDDQTARFHPPDFLWDE